MWVVEIIKTYNSKESCVTLCREGVGDGSSTISSHSSSSNEMGN